MSGARRGSFPPPTLSVFLDCRRECDDDLIRTDITWVNWVRDRTVADVHVLVTSQDAGAGGDEFTLAFLGNRSMAARGDTLTFTTNPTTTFDEQRRGIARTIALGLVPFVARTPAGQSLVITRDSTAPSAVPQTSAVHDPWRAWVFQTELRGSTSGEQAYASRDVTTQFSANRITAAWKSALSYEYNYRSTRATVTDLDSLGDIVSSETFTNILRDWRGEASQVMRVTDHAGLAANFEVASQIFRNQKLRYSVRLAAEYNLFPYSEVTRRELTVTYGLGGARYQYADTTIYGQIEEVLPLHFFEVSYRTRQPWGNVSFNMEHRNFLTDASKRSTDVNGFFSVRVFRGFNVNMGGSYSWIRDQIYLPQGSRNTVDVLLRRRALATGFEFRLNAGVRYTFGSIYNNVVSPRF